MGQYEYGVFAYAWVWFLVFSAVATLGLGDSPVRYVAQLRARGEDDYLRGFIRFASLDDARRVGRLQRASHRDPAALRRRMTRAGLPDADGVHGGGHSVRLHAAFLEGLGRSYDWTIPALLPNYILRHGSAPRLHGRERCGSASRRRRGTASSASS